MGGRRKTRKKKVLSPPLLVLEITTDIRVEFINYDFSAKFLQQSFSQFAHRLFPAKKLLQVTLGCVMESKLKEKDEKKKRKKMKQKDSKPLVKGPLGKTLPLGGEKKKIRAKSSKKVALSLDLGDDDDDCSAAKCMKPIGECGSMVTNGQKTFKSGFFRGSYILRP